MKPTTGTAPPLSAQQLLDTLHGLCEGEPSRHCTALIDVSRHDDSASCAAALGMDDATFESLPNLYGTFASTMKRQGPRLYSAPSELPWRQICEQATSRQTASFIIHGGTPGALGDHLKSLIRLKQPDGSKRLFRFQDSVVLSTLAPLLTIPQQRALLGPAHAWVVLDVCGRPSCLEPSARTGPQPSSLVLSPHQVRDLDVGLRPATIIAQANATDSSLLDGKSRCEQWQIVRRSMEHAASHGLDTREDVALYCVLSLQLPAGFDMTGPVARALQRNRKDNIGFGEAIDQVPVEEWRAWDDELDAMEKVTP